MTPATLHTETRRYIPCPECGLQTAHLVSHLTEPCSWGPWYCDGCGLGIVGRLRGDGSVEYETTASRKEDLAVLLRHPTAEPPLWLIVRGMRFGGEEEDGSRRYYYEEHTCPSNYHRATMIVIEGQDSDPHGVYEYAGEIPIRGNEEVLGVHPHPPTSVDGETLLALFGECSGYWRPPTEQP